MFVTWVTLHFDPAKRDIALAAAAKAEAGTHQEPGSLFYKFVADLHDPGVLHVIEHWRSEEDLVKHMETPHLRVFMKMMKDAGIHALEGTHYDVTTIKNIPMPEEWK